MSTGRDAASLDRLLQGLTEDLPSAELPAPTGVCLDSRQVKPGYLYLAVAGASSHGLLHADAAIDAGASVVLFDSADPDPYADTIEAIRARGVPLIGVPGLKSSVGEIASRFHRRPDRDLRLIAVTGTDGKTSVCRFIADALSAEGCRCGYIGTLGWGVGEQLAATSLTTPDAATLRALLASLRDTGCAAVALEASSHGIAEGRLDGLTLRVAVLTNLGRDHLDYHVDLEAYRAAKARLFEWPEIEAIVVNADDSLGDQLLQGLPREGVRRIGYSLAGRLPMPEADVRVGATDVQASPDGLSFRLIDGDFERLQSSRLIGRFNVANLLACHGVLRAFGFAPERASNALDHLQAVPGRMERFSASGAPTVIVDYSHTPQALTAAIEAARAHCHGELWVVFGCGGDRDPGKRAPMGRAAEAADRIVVTDDNPRTETSASIIEAIVSGMHDAQRATVIADRSSAIRHAIAEADTDDVVLVAGKGHEDYQIVGTDRLDYSDRRWVGELLAEAC